MVEKQKLFQSSSNGYKVTKRPISSGSKLLKSKTWRARFRTEMWFVEIADRTLWYRQHGLVEHLIMSPSQKSDLLLWNNVRREEATYVCSFSGSL